MVESQWWEVWMEIYGQEPFQFRRYITVDLDHFVSVDESYLRHLITAWGYAAILLVLTVILVVHGVIPFIFTRTASRTIQKMLKHMQSRWKFHGQEDYSLVTPCLYLLVSLCRHSSTGRGHLVFHVIEVKALCNTQTDADTVVELLTLLQETHKDIRIIVTDHSKDIQGPDKGWTSQWRELLRIVIGIKRGQP